MSSSEQPDSRPVPSETSPGESMEGVSSESPELPGQDGKQQAEEGQPTEQAPESLDEHVLELDYQGRRILLLGTAHVSPRSVREVRALIERERPDTVCVELDPTRYEAMTDEDRWKRLDIFDVIKQKKVLFLLANLALSSYQKRLGEKFGVKPGAEMLEAIEAAKRTGAELVLADRDIQATLKRTWANLSFWNKSKVVGLLVGVFLGGEGEEVDEDMIEKLKDRDTINEMLQEFAKVLPQVKEPLIDERDKYLMASIREAPGKNIVAVVGAGHVSGMTTHLHEPVDKEALSRIPPPTLLSRSLKWIIPVIVLLAFGYGYWQHSGETLEKMLYAWIIPNSVMAGLLAIVAGAKPLTVLSVVVASPITSLNPTIGAGMVGGLVEAWLRKPTVEDCERITEDMTTIKGMYRNRFTRVLLVAFLSTMGSALGAWIGASWVVTLLGG